ncbi:MAG: response regulator [Desulfomonilia bacterium]|uniref:Transcriptional regulatory protein YycF n=1 Tax=anaerobic digester metagenome TaxID=1263854 RepID=A0A485M456_9ZZZZ|nr:response regulator [Pseudomonadota bacterium]HON38852.1 response regulator [Deltaproteobacteria bacterium]HRS56837.1 response regulator [Desulfomonilia bacterium]HPD22002.1 response regulator [Deltaproteobacteria bacterium]HPW69958.1 response regulator [Deltaproteobacteria bacterium]
MDAKKKILLIDDDKDFLMATKLILEKGGYEVFLAEDGKSGVEMAKSVNPNLAIVDMMMETWSEGFNVVSKLRTSDSGKQIPLIMLSAVDLQGPYQSFEPPEGLPTVDMVLHKPIKADDLLRHVGSLLGE